MAASRVLLFALALSSLHLSSASQEESMSAFEIFLKKTASARPMQQGSFCSFDKTLKPIAPFCPGNPYNCVIKTVPNLMVQIYSGQCDAKYSSGSYCKLDKAVYAIGTSGIRSNPLCQTCTCKAIYSLVGKNKGACMCNSLPPCYVDYNGKPRGKFICPAHQNMCVVTQPGGGGKDAQGNPIDMGQCVYSGIGSLCATGGSNWGPKFYMKGVQVPKGNDRCTSCTCGASGVLSNCRAVRGCKGH